MSTTSFEIVDAEYAQTHNMMLCPPCRDGEHWNHEDRNRRGYEKPGGDWVEPEPGACWTMGRQGRVNVPCACAWRAS